jgi:hypothetical protein
MSKKVLAAFLLVVAVCSACGSDRECGIGQVPNYTLRGCVTLPPCDGGVVNELNECVRSVEEPERGIDGGVEEAGGDGSMDAGSRTRDSSPAKQDVGGMSGVSGSMTAQDGGVGMPNQKAAGAGGDRTSSAAGAGGADEPEGSSSGSGASMPRAAFCGDGHPDPGELCDGNCPTSCDPGAACAPLMLSGSAAMCTAQCLPNMISQCVGGDGCCPTGCTHATDVDCPVTCGDGVIDKSKKCDPQSTSMPCPTSCDDGNPCTVDMLIGTAMQCSAECVHTPITAAVGGDGCCPSGANANTDSDCPTRCGDGVVTGNEKCDPQSSCPSSCSSSDACHPATLQGAASTCDAICSTTTITAAVGGDGCCPSGANANTDSDCPTRCGDGVVTGDESCDGNCPTSCPALAGSGCVQQKLVGSAAQCTAKCESVTASDGLPCMNTGVCVGGQCQYCGDGIVNRDEECDPAALGWSTTTCGADCKRAVYKRCGSGSSGECPGGQHCWTGYCTTSCTANTTPNGPGTECPKIPNVGTPFCYTNQCVLPCGSTKDCPSGLDLCDNSATLGSTGAGSTCSSTGRN